MNNRIMVDLETLGVKPGSAIMSIGAVRFDQDGPKDEFYVRVSLESSVDAGLKMDGSTVLWWMTQSEESRAELLQPGITLFEALTQFHLWAIKGGEIDEIWGDGPTFDNVILRCAYDAVEMEAPWNHWADRCYRTMKNLYPDLAQIERTGTFHNALDDARTQVERLIPMLRRTACPQLIG